ncbi:hypothetical protein JL722_4762 [Aureococcus anophagefferens]|nr:hypothetical protein JL722_4762 [Aureococcus anophagefferens]
MTVDEAEAHDFVFVAAVADVAGVDGGAVSVAFSGARRRLDEGGGVAVTYGIAAASSAEASALGSDLADVDAEAVDAAVAKAAEDAGVADAFADVETLLATFDVATDRAGFAAGVPFGCGAVLAFAGADAASCYWVDASRVSADVGPATAFSPGDNATLVAGVLRVRCAGRCDCDAPANASSVVTAPPAAPVAPVAVLEGLRPSARATASPSTRLSTGGGGRDLTYAWSAAPGDASAVAGLALHAAGVDALEVTVVVANFLGGVSAPAAPLVVEIRRDAPPVLEVVGGVALAAYRPDALSVRAEAIATSCDGREAADRAVAITWRLFDDAGGLVDLASTSNDQRYFKLPAYSLEAANIYALEATAVDVVGGANATQTVALSVGTSPVVAVLAGGDRVVPAAAALDVDASGSYDGDRRSEPSTSPRNVRDRGDRDGPDGRGRRAATYVVAAEPAPVVAVDGPAGRVAATSRVVLYGSASHGGGGNATTAWRLAAGNLAGDAPLGAWARTALRDAGPLDGLRRHDLALEPRALVAGAAYSFALDAAAGGAVGGASVTIYASRPPSSGVVEAAPPRGVALETRFELRTSSWASEDPPLTYAFRARSGASSSTLHASSLATSLGDVVLPGNNTIVAVATDALGAAAEAAATVAASAAPAGDALAALAAARLDEARALGDSEGVCMTVVAAAPGADAGLTAAALVAVAANGSALGAASASAALGAAADLAGASRGLGVTSAARRASARRSAASSRARSSPTTAPRATTPARPSAPRSTTSPRRSSSAPRRRGGPRGPRGNLRMAARRLPEGGAPALTVAGASTAAGLGGLAGDATLAEYDAPPYAGALASKVARFGLAKPSRARRLAAAGRFSLTFHGAAPANATGGNATCAPGADDVSWACGGNLTLTAPCLPGAVVAFFCPFDEAACVAWNGTAWDAACDAAVDGAAVTCDCPAAPAPADYAVTARSVLGTYAYAFAAAPGAAIAATPLLYWTLAALVGACAAVAAVGVVLDARDEARLDDDAWRRAYERSRERGATLGEIVEASMPSFVGRLRGGALRWALELVRSHHSWCRILTHFARDAPRHRRCVTLLFTVLMIMFGQAVAYWFAYPVGFCERAEHRDDCLAKRTFFAEMVGALAGDGDPDRDACVWSDAPRRGEDRCALRAPEPHDVGFKRLFLIFLGVVLAIPFTELFDATFVRYVCAPVAWTRAAREAPEKRREPDREPPRAPRRAGDGGAAAGAVARLLDDLERRWAAAPLRKPRAERPRGWERAFAERTLRRLVHGQRVAAHYAEIARRVDDRRKAAALVVNLMRLARLSDTEAKILEQQLAADGAFDAPGPAPARLPAVSPRAKVAASVACLAAFAGPVYFLLVFAAAEGRKMTRAWYFSTLFFIFIAVGIVEPFTVFILKFCLPASAYAKLRWMRDPTLLDDPARVRLFVEPAALLPDDVASCFGALGADAPAARRARRAPRAESLAEEPATNALLDEAAAGFARVDAPADADRDGERRAHEAFAALGGAWEVAALERQAKRAKFAAPLYHGAAMAAAAAVLAVHPALRSCVIKQGMILVSLGICGSRVAFLRAFLDRADRAAPGLGPVALAWAAMVAACLAAVAVFKVRWWLTSLRRSAVAAERALEHAASEVAEVATSATRRASQLLRRRTDDDGGDAADVPALSIDFGDDVAESDGRDAPPRQLSRALARRRRAGRAPGPLRGGARVAALVDAHHFGWAGVAGTALSSALLYADVADGGPDVEVAAGAARRGSKAYATLLTSAKGQAAKAVNELRGSVFS